MDMQDGTLTSETERWKFRKLQSLSVGIYLLLLSFLGLFLWAYMTLNSGHASLPVRLPFGSSPFLPIYDRVGQVYATASYESPPASPIQIVAQLVIAFAALVVLPVLCLGNVFVTPFAARWIAWKIFFRNGLHKEYRQKYRNLVSAGFDGRFWWCLGIGCAWIVLVAYGFDKCGGALLPPYYAKLLWLLGIVVVCWPLYVLIWYVVMRLLIRARRLRLGA